MCYFTLHCYENQITEIIDIFGRKKNRRPLFLTVFCFPFHVYMKCSFALARPSVRLSVRPSHGWISQKGLNLGSCNFTLIH